MENRPKYSPVEEQDKGTNNELNPNFDFKGVSITPADIKEDAGKHLGHKKLPDNENIFPVNVFPKLVQQIVSDTNTHLKYPVDFIGASLLYAVSVAIGNSYRIEVVKGWQEAPVIYLAIVARAGTNKSHPLTFAIRPLQEHDKRTYREYELKLKEYKDASKLTKPQREKENIADPIKPVWNKLLLSDFTPEGLAEVHKYNKRGLGVYIDELAGWFKNFNRYNSGSEMEFWLSSWSGKPINIDRKTGEPVFIPFPFISVAGTIQNGVLNELAKDNRTENGFIDRILFVIPDNVKKEYWSEKSINSDTVTVWENIILSLLDLPLIYDETNSPKPAILQFSLVAKQTLLNWQKANTDFANNSESDAISGICSKMETYAVRLALILQLLSNACGESNAKEVSLTAVEGALQLVEYFRNSAFKVNALIANFNPLDKFPTVKRNLYEALPDVFTTTIAIQIGETLKIPERTVKRFLNERELFNRLKQGEYEKRI